MSSYLIARDCTGRCNQGRACTCTQLWQRSGGARIDTEQMISSGAIEGPYKRAHPITLSLRQRLSRWIRRHLVGGPECGEAFK